MVTNGSVTPAAAQAALAEQGGRMPWKSSSRHAECEGPARRSDTGELVACHDSMASAEAHMAALYANVPEGRSAFTVDEFWDGLALVPNPRGHLQRHGAHRGR